LFETSAQESISEKQGLTPSIQNSPQQEGINPTSDISSEGASGSVISFYKEVHSIA
jgi:hypothetical protein